tara:strand:+ start:27785 stop:28258 length:474 start_codon:yes stop_codon:yes gene_type:complete
LPLFAFTALHKYYISVTEIDYVKEKKSVQITTRIFADDFEKLLRTRYDKNIMLDDANETRSTELYIEKYLKEKITIKINGKETSFDFIGKEYDVDIVICYLEIPHVSSIASFEISNTVLFDLFEEQQNIVKTKINSKQKSYMLIPQEDKVQLEFDSK